MGYEEKLEKELNTEPSPLSVTKTRAKLDKAIETVEKHNAIVAEACEKPAYHPARVYVTYQTQGQVETCLSNTRVGYTALYNNKTNNKNAVFESTDSGGAKIQTVLQVCHAHEPSEVIWEYLGNSNKNLAFQFFKSSMVIIAFLFLDYQLLYKLHRNRCDQHIISLVVAIFNGAGPVFCKKITAAFEQHNYESTHEASVLIKLAALRIMNFGLIIFCVVRYNQVMHEHFLTQVQSLLLMNCFGVPLIRNTVQFTVFAVKALLGRCTSMSQEELNKAFMGVKWTLGERYTDLIKTIFMGASQPTSHPAPSPTPTASIS